MRASHCVPDRLAHLRHALGCTSFDGLYLECGVGAGTSLNLIADTVSPALVFGFDSFEGLPEPWRKRRDGTATLPSGSFAQHEPPIVRPNARLIVGAFARAIPEFARGINEPIAFLNIDSDLYGSARTVLAELNSWIRPGTLVNFDEIVDWSADEHRYDTWRDGEYRAVTEWLAQFGRDVEPVSRDSRYGAALRVTR